MATVSLLFTATLIVEGSGMTFSAMFQSRMEKASAFDLYIGTKNEAHLDAYQDQIRRSVPVTAVRRYAVYQGRTPRSPTIWRTTPATTSFPAGTC